MLQPPVPELQLLPNELSEDIRRQAPCLQHHRPTYPTFSSHKSSFRSSHTMGFNAPTLPSIIAHNIHTQELTTIMKTTNIAITKKMMPTRTGVRHFNESSNITTSMTHFLNVWKKTDTDI